jgi:hypothetical protein
LLTSGIISCTTDKPVEPVHDMLAIEKVLNNFVLNLVSDLPDTSNISNRIKLYLLAQPEIAFGSTVSLLDNSGIATFSPYWYKMNDSLD